MEQDKIFNALADPHRRQLLDMLFQQDGQTLNELCAPFAISRFGVMKHLGLLEEAGLIVTRKVGREKFHYLNPVPIQEVYNRWVSKYAQPWTQTLIGLKHHLENPPMTTKPTHVYETYIRTTPEQLWNALTNGDITRHYYYGTRAESSWQDGAPYSMTNDEGVRMQEGEVISSNPPHQLVASFRLLFSDEWQDAPAATMTYDIVPLGETCKLTVTLTNVEPRVAKEIGVDEGWAYILAGLKTYLETGEPLVIPSTM